MGAVLALSVGAGFFGCANGLDDSKKDNGAADSRAVTLNPSVDVTIYLYGVPASCTNPGVWAWAKAASDTSYTEASWPGDMVMEADDSQGYDGYKYVLKVDPAYDLGILFNNNSGGAPQTSDIIIPKKDIASNVTYYFNWNSMAYYDSVDDCIGIMGGSITALDAAKGTATVVCTTSLLDDATVTGDVTVTDAGGKTLTVESAVIKSDELTIYVKSASDADVSKSPYTINHESKTVVVSVSTALIEKLYGEKASAVTDLGLTFLSGTTATFKSWAPTASAVSVLLYDTAANAYDTSLTTDFDGPGTTEKDYKKATYAPKESAMEVDSATGVWSVTEDISGFKFYKYKISVDGNTYYVADIWNNVAGADSNASQIATVDDVEAKPDGWETSYTNPFGSNGTETKKYNDAVIYEMHIRDWSRAVESDSTGKFLDIANSTAIMSHLKDLGVTHVQILPMFDYAQLNSNKNYNWGYNPYHYNVPEGRYVTEGYTDGTQAVKEMRAMIKAFHDNGIAVIMDVVYNHTSSNGGGSLYDSTVPGYFYSLDTSGNYYNGSGCGNNLDTRHAMVQKYVIDSLKHWVNDYHINGFRFDLMGVMSKDCMKAAYDALYALDKNILVYGEPWTGGETGLNGETEETTAAGKGTKGYGYGAFDDDFRDAIKGGEFGGFGTGQVQGSFNANIETGLTGDEITKNSRNATGITGLALHYAECHDNFTLFDKLVYSTLSPLPSGDSYASKFKAAYEEVMKDSAKLALIKKEQMLAGAYVILSQGTPFINGGQEFMRTKKGDPDSYAADTKGGIKWTSSYNGGTYVAATDIDDVNTIDLELKTKYADVYNTYKGLIALRKLNDAFTDPTECSAKKIADGVTQYVVTGKSGTFEVLFNAGDTNYAGLSFTGAAFGAGVKDFSVEFAKFSGKRVSISEEDGSVNIADEATSVTSIPAKSFVIFKK